MKEVLYVNQKIIELWIGIEHLSDKELNALIFMIENNSNKQIFNRLIVHGPIPLTLNELNLNVSSFQINHFFQHSSSINISRIFYNRLLKALLMVYSKSEIYDYDELLQSDAFKSLILFSKLDNMKSILLNAIPTMEILLEKPFQLNDHYFWYQLNDSFINMPRSKKRLRHFKLDTTGKLSELVSSRIIGQGKSMQEIPSKELDSELPNKLQLELEIIPKKNSEETVKEWNIYYNNIKIGDEKSDARFILVLEQLFKNYQKKIIIDADKLAEIIYKPDAEKVANSKKKSIKCPEKTFRQLRLDFQKKYTALGNITEYFVFSYERCYYDPRGELRLLVIRK